MQNAIEVMIREAKIITAAINWYVKQKFSSVQLTNAPYPKISSAAIKKRMMQQINAILIKPKGFFLFGFI